MEKNLRVNESHKGDYLKVEIKPLSKNKHKQENGRRRSQSICGNKGIMRHLVENIYQNLLIV